MEEWKPIIGFENYYEISNYGRIKSKSRVLLTPTGVPYYTKSRILKPKIDKKGYHRIELNSKKDDLRGTFKIHRLVGQHFIENKENKPQINHIDGNKANNHQDNLEWCNNSENRLHAIKNGLIKSHEGRSDSKLTYEIACKIRAEYVPRSKTHSIRKIAQRYNVSPTTIRQILDGKTYHK